MKLILQQPGVREIRVKVMLAGGHAAMLVLPPDHPLLAQLLQTIAATNGRRPDGVPSVFQIPAEGGRASLTFASHQLVGIVTDPAILVQSDSDDAPASVSTVAPTGAATPTPSPDAAPRIVRHAVVQLDGFLTADECAWLRDTVIAAQGEFRSSWTNDEGNKDYRQSMVLNAPDAIVRLVVGRIRSAMPDVMAKLGMPAFPVGHIECQVTASTDGSYFRVHTDRGEHAIDATRQLTYVYYFNREPKVFTGGELRVYDDQIRNGKLARTDQFQIVEPRNNSIVFFNAAVMHEVTPVFVPGKDFRDSRFTVNGWVHRA
jgi:Rps23 Pro-64 3,4-dihydroxylase Tpa1-like proline 4-hydroxylase